MTSRASEVLPDFIVRKHEAGQRVSAEHQEAWEHFQALFFAPVLPNQAAKDG